MQVEHRMSPALALQFAQRLAALVEEIEATPDDPSGIPIRALIGWYGLTDPAGSVHGVTRPIRGYGCRLGAVPTG